MSFHFEAAGTLDQVRHQLGQAAKYGDTSQVDAVLSFVHQELDAMPTAMPPEYERGAYVKGSGHHDGSGRYLVLEVRSLSLRTGAQADA